MVRRRGNFTAWETKLVPLYFWGWFLLFLELVPSVSGVVLLYFWAQLDAVSDAVCSCYRL